MNKHLEQRRKGYLSYFKDGVADGLMLYEMDKGKTFSVYYKQGYAFGKELWDMQSKNVEIQYQELANDYKTFLEDERKKNGRAI